jgi:hypothetical protein
MAMTEKESDKGTVGKPIFSEADGKCPYAS